MPQDPADDDVARAWPGGLSGLVIKGALAVVSVVYFVSVWAEAAIHQGASSRWLRPSLEYFAEIASLFEKPTAHAVDYLVEGYRCRDKKWVDIDVSPWFPIDADNKENRFHRAVYFYRDRAAHRPTMRALDEFVVSHYDARLPSLEDALGGVRITKILVPVGAPGGGSPRIEHRPLASYPEDERTDFYHSPESMREERCSQLGR